MKQGTVLILGAMNAEYEYLLSQLELTQKSTVGGYTFYEGTVDGIPVVVAHCLIGMVNAALCTALAIERYSPACVIIQGSAGAHEISLQKKDIVIAENIVSLSHTVSPVRGVGEGTDPLSWEDFGVHCYCKEKEAAEETHRIPCDRELVRLAQTVPYTEGKVIVGTVGCADVWNREADLIRHYHEKRGTSCEAMEGLGAAQACAAFGVPMLEIRVISNNELRENEAFSADTVICAQKFVLGLLPKIRSRE